MRKNLIRFIVIILICISSIYVLQVRAQVQDPVPLTNLRAGIAKVDITPAIGIPLGGYGTERYATGIHDPLYATVLVFDDGKKKAALVGLDLIQIMQEPGENMREAIEEVTGIPEDNIIINASHTHGSPWLKAETVYPGPWEDEADPIYTKIVIDKVAGAAKLAVDQLRPVSIGYSEGKIDFNINRRWIDEEGKCHGKLNPEGICDHRVKILRIDDGNDVSPMAVVMHAVCHPNVFRGANTEISGDFSGIAQSFLERNFSNKTIAIFLQGCCGDIRSNMPGGGYGRSGSEADMTWCGWSLGAEAVRVATKERVREQIKKRESNFEIAAATDILRLEADTTELRSTLRDRIIDGRILVPIRVLRVGNFYFIGLPGEPVVEYGLKIEEKMKDLGKIFVLGFITGDNGYIPVSHMIPEGGYEVAGRPYTESAEKEIINGVERLVAKIK